MYANCRIQQVVLPEDFLFDIRSPDTPIQYLGQPDIIRTETDRLITVCPIGHGHGPVVMQITDDRGTTWNEKTDIPKSWMSCQKSAAPHILKLADGKERIILISACPGKWDNYIAGWDMS